MNSNQNNAGIIAIFVFISLIVGFILGSMFGSTGSTKSVSEVGAEIKEVMSGDTSQSEGVNSASGEVESELVAGNPDEVAFTFDVSKLPSAQQTALRTVGIKEDKISITKGMVACAEAKVGADRMVEIQNGAGPSISEGLVLATCYSSS